MEAVLVREAGTADREAIRQVLTASWGSTTVVAHGCVYDAGHLPALLAERDGKVVGLLTYTLADRALEVVSLDAVVPHAGVGTALLSRAADLARQVAEVRRCAGERDLDRQRREVAQVGERTFVD